MDAADRWVAIRDGGSGLEDWLRVYFPRVEAVIVDFRHAAQHVSEWAKARHPDDAAEAARVAGGGATSSSTRVGRRPMAREAHRQLLVDVANQVPRMDDPTYRSEGWMIGSGPVEAACKPVVNQRLKVTGVRWSEAGADGVCHLRALFRSEIGQWDAYRAATAA